MNFTDIQKLLRTHGLSHVEASNVAAQIAKREQKRDDVLRTHDWDYVLEPLVAQIKSLASSQKVWGICPVRAKPYAKYLRLLRATRDTIKSYRDTNLANEPIAEVAARASKVLGYDIPRKGMVWSAWVPEAIQEKVRLTLEQVYSHPDMARKGKRLIPFSTRRQRLASDVRWTKILTTITTELMARVTPGLDRFDDPNEPLITALQEAREAVHERSLSAEAPVKWEHLVSENTKKRLNEWQARTFNGLRDAS